MKAKVYGIRVRPRHAATLVAWRIGAKGIEVLMGRRAARHSFVPHHYVFPGGRIDRADYRAPTTTRLRPDVAQRLCSHCSPEMAHALAVTAVRETFEETGLALGDRDGGTVKPDLRRLDYLLRAITPASSPIRFHARFFAAEASHFSGTLRGNGELLDLGWRPVGECLKLPIVDVTEYLLTRLAREQTLAWKKGEELFSFRNGVARLQ